MTRIREEEEEYSKFCCCSCVGWDLATCILSSQKV